MGQVPHPNPVQSRYPCGKPMLAGCSWIPIALRIPHLTACLACPRPTLIRLNRRETTPDSLHTNKRPRPLTSPMASLLNSDICICIDIGIDSRQLQTCLPASFDHTTLQNTVLLSGLSRASITCSCFTSHSKYL